MRRLIELKRSLIPLVVLLLTGSTTQASEIRLTIEADTDPDPKQVKVWEDYSLWNVDPKPPIGVGRTLGYGGCEA